jgi:predicted porin
MNNTIKLAVASALLAAASSASAAGGIVAGDWTLDIGGVVNAYMTSTKTNGAQSVSSIETGLLPNVLAVSGKTRQNDLDVNFTISIQPGSSTSQGLANYNTATQENRQAFLTFGDASWGSVKLGKDLGIYASQAILNDMTLLGVGAGAGAGQATTTLGRIGGGYIYADWKSQVSYTTPNFNGFSATVGATQAWNTYSSGVTAATPYAFAVADATAATSTLRGGGEPAFEAAASYAFSADAVSGKVWASGITQNMQLSTTVERNSSAWDIGANVNVAGFGLTGYYGEGKGTGTVIQFRDAYTNANAKRNSDDWYVQGTYAVPGVGTKLGVSYGESTLDGVTAGSDDNFNSKVREQLTFGAYHPLTKHLNLVAEYTELNAKTDLVSGTDTSSKAKTYSLGAILFF